MLHSYKQLGPPCSQRPCTSHISHRGSTWPFLLTQPCVRVGTCPGLAKGENYELWEWVLRKMWQFRIINEKIFMRGNICEKQNVDKAGKPGRAIRPQMCSRWRREERDFWYKCSRMPCGLRKIWKVVMESRRHSWPLQEFLFSMSELINTFQSIAEIC